MQVSKQRRAVCLRVLFNAAATVQVVWFYLARVHSAFSLEAFEQGQAPVPFQHRLAMRPLLSWAHHSASLRYAAHWLTQQHAWFTNGVRPESLVELPADLAAVVLTGCIAEAIYRRATRAHLLRGFVYPLTLCMVAIVFNLYTVHSLRFVYDLPAMAVFATGLFLLYTRRPLWVFALLFLGGTLNRETTLMLLPALLLQQWSAPRLRLAIVLVCAWAGWHVWVTQLFASNPTASGARMLLNLGILLCPLAWPQLCTFAPLCLAPFLYESDGRTGQVLRRWRLLIPLWFVFMLRYGLLIETRVFGELIAFLAPMTALAFEQRILERMQQSQRVTTRTALASVVKV